MTGKTERRVSSLSALVLLQITKAAKNPLRVNLGPSPTRVTHLSRAGDLSPAGPLLSRYVAQWLGVIAVGAGSKSGLVKQARV
jgi:hypothetical protein